MGGLGGRIGTGVTFPVPPRIRLPLQGQHLFSLHAIKSYNAEQK